MNKIPGFNPGIPGLAFFNPEMPGLEKKSGIAIPTHNATRSSHEKAVCLSVCQTRDLWQKERKARFLYHTKGHL